MAGAQESVRERILAAAKAEVALYGTAGARVERIAKRAQTSKERLYAYFSTKQALFDEVTAGRYARMARMVPPLDANDLPGFVGKMFDFYTSDPDELRLYRWAALEEDASPMAPDDPRFARYRGYISEIERGQKAGVVEASWPPLDLFNLLIILAMAWPSAPHTARQLADHAAGRRELASHRKSAVEAARRLTTPKL